MVLDERSDSVGHREHPEFRFLAEDASLSSNLQSLFLPLNIALGQAGELRDAEPGVKERPDNQLLAEALAGVDQLVNLGIIQPCRL